MRREKLNTPVEIPLRLDMRPYAPHSNHQSTKSAEYSLFGISHHSGSLYGGHYIAEVRSGGSWYRCNDSTVAKIPAPDHQSSSSAYVLFYVMESSLKPKL
mmetsp:Transcript_25949/g.19553  ORF Transcript_25949/g.19553 Transcript_25949/m.19553 type:complete len:100 (+) Transcript_25949:689-988(+)